MCDGKRLKNTSVLKLHIEDSEERGAYLIAWCDSRRKQLPGGARARVSDKVLSAMSGSAYGGRSKTSFLIDDILQAAPSPSPSPSPSSLQAWLPRPLPLYQPLCLQYQHLLDPSGALAEAYRGKFTRHSYFPDNPAEGGASCLLRNYASIISLFLFWYSCCFK